MAECLYCPMGIGYNARSPFPFSLEFPPQVIIDIDPFLFFHARQYVWCSDRRRFFKLYGLERDVSLKTIHEHFRSGLTEPESVLKRVLYGSNKIVVRVTPLFALLVTEAINPFYIFQIFSMVLWLVDGIAKICMPHTLKYREKVAKILPKSFET